MPGGPHPPVGTTARSHADRHFTATATTATTTAPSPYAAPQTTAVSWSTISFNFSAPSQLGPPFTSPSSGTSTVVHRANFVKGPAPSSPHTSTTPPSGTTNRTGGGNGTSKGKAKGNAKGATTGKGHPNANGQGGRPPASRRTRNGRTGLARTLATPPAQSPARPERFFTIPLTALAPAPAASGLLPGGGLSLAPAAKAGSQLFHFGASMLPRGWAGESLHEADQLKLPIALLIAIAVFMLGQSLVDRRDPKVSEAPERPNDDSLDFQ